MSRSTVAGIIGLFCGTIGFFWGWWLDGLNWPGGMQKTIAKAVILLFVGIAIGYALGPKEKE